MVSSIGILSFFWYATTETEGGNKKSSLIIMHSICARVYIHFVFFSTLSLPLVTLIPKQVRIHLFIFARIVFFLILFKVAFSLFSLFMDELHRAVAPFLPASGGIHSGVNPPPGPSGDPSFFPLSSTNDNQQQPGPSEGQARAPRN